MLLIPDIKNMLLPVLMTLSHVCLYMCLHVYVHGMFK